MKATRYFVEQVLRKRPYLTYDMCVAVVARPEAWSKQDDGRTRFWAAVPELDGRYLRVVTLEDGETIRNVFPDRNFTGLKR